LVSLGAWCAWRRKHYTFVRFTMIVAMLPWSLAFPLAFPLTAWFLLELSDPAVRAAFAGSRRAYPPLRDPRKRSAAETEATGQFICLPVKLGSLSEHRYPGMLRLEGDALILEYMKGYVRAKVREAIIQISHLRFVRLTSGGSTIPSSSTRPV